MVATFDKRKIAAINRLKVVDYSISGNECEFVAVADTAENRQALLAAGFTPEQIDSDEVREGFRGMFDVAHLAFQIAGAGWYTVHHGFQQRLPKALPTNSQAMALLWIYEREYAREEYVSARSASVCERNGWIRRIVVNTGLMRSNGPLTESYWQISDEGIDALNRYAQRGADKSLRQRVHESLEAGAAS